MLRKTLFVFCLATAAVSLAFPSSQSVAEGPRWIRDVDQGRTQAQAEGKDLFILFTGHGWCAQCEVLDREVFQKDEFVDAAGADYVLVELEFNFGDSPEEKAREKKYREIQRRYLVKAFPTILLADPNGVPYAMIIGYEDGDGPAKTLAAIRAAQAGKQERDRHFRLADTASGMRRIEHLHRGIQSVAERLGSLEDCGDDPVLVFYKSQVDEILKSAGDGCEKIQRQYEVRLRKRDARREQEAVFAKLKEFDAARDYQGAIDYIGDTLKTTEDPGTRWRLERSRQVYLEWDDQHEKALANVRRLLRRPDLPEKYREYLIEREPYNLFKLGRIDEGLTLYDRLIAEEKDRDKRLSLLSSKAQMILGRNRPRQSIAVWEVYREAAKPGTEDWFTATALLGRQHAKLGEHRKALALFEEFLAYDKLPHVMLDAAGSHIALGEHAKARELIERVEREAASLEQSERKSDRDTAEQLKKWAAKLREKVGKGQ